jgi:hypothetical protein
MINGKGNGFFLLVGGVATFKQPVNLIAGSWNGRGFFVYH